MCMYAFIVTLKWFECLKNAKVKQKRGIHLRLKIEVQWGEAPCRQKT